MQGVPGDSGATVTGGMVLNAPFPSGAVRGLASLRAGHSTARPHLLSYTGSLEGSVEGAALRRALARQCDARGDEALCRTLKITPGTSLASDTVSEAYKYSEKGLGWGPTPPSGAVATGGSGAPRTPVGRFTPLSSHSAARFSPIASAARAR